jgi:hypothetical protein
VIDEEDELNEDNLGLSDNAPCSPSKCGDCWLGDNLCQQELDQMESESAHFESHYVQTEVTCPGCSMVLTSYQIPANELWVWPGVWPEDHYYSPIMALNIFAAMGAPKGEVHEPAKVEDATVHHIWIGSGKYRTEKLIRLTGSLREERMTEAHG